MKTVEGKVVLVTGAAMGMGRMYAERAVAERAKSLMLWDIDDAALQEAAASLEGSDTSIHLDHVDVGSRRAVAAAAKRARRAVGDPDIVFNNAGVIRGNSYFWETADAAEAELTMKVDALGLMFVAHEFLPGMVQSGAESRLVNIASAAGLTPVPRMAVYCGAKWAVVGWSESVRLELERAGHRHVRVTTACPFYLKHGMFEGASSALLLPLLDPEDVVEKVWRAMKRGDAMVLVPRTVLLAEILKGVVPLRLRDRLAALLGVHSTMDDFTGRRTPDDPPARSH